MRRAKKKSKTEEYKSGTDERDTDSSRYVTKGNVKPENSLQGPRKKSGSWAEQRRRVEGERRRA